MTDLVVGKQYQVRWPKHYNQHQREVGYLAKFLGWRTSRCALHGDRLGQQALFVRVKGNGTLGVQFASPLFEIELELRDE